ncbi:hydroxymethylglutaryl-CoA reductase [Aliiglaciecola lipolytica]|uniref:hydroxymethylglutaryl-CoA reductase (NADPH) n=1 Tax=Aliiglaciecola lipolytica E3 TaxID=1127673 RepID=K6YDA2_9ALTE|nr:hydroxymethylglutaryl-CoA reductase [Aliiglaciecola lipolytica]GAC14628.1 3-hydroxy-3-methylglutaryl-coenzyme A reductase [Aliiglaciecola lipolytica E3]
MTDDTRIPRSSENDHTVEMAKTRREFLKQKTGTDLKYTGEYSIDPAILPGNIENFIGIVQMPVGIAGPVQINGEHAKGQFYIPLATTEGTLVASYSRGMRVINECGGVKTTVVEGWMQRAPAFIFEDARQARDFGEWVEQNFEQIKAISETTTSVGKLEHIQQWSVAKTRYLRFNYTTGDAAGQNMVGKATLVACEWIKANSPIPCMYLLSGNMDTDKKHSHLNMLHSRGKRVIAEIVLKKEVLARVMKVDTKMLAGATTLANTGALMAGAAYNGPHSANGIASLYIATGQDEANVVESHAGMLSHQLLDNGDFYLAVTLPSLIVATFGGGTGLPTQNECLQLLGCVGKDKANKFAEIVAATVLAGDISLACAVIAGHWVSSHDKMGRNR